MTTFSPTTLAALHTVATNDEVDTLVGIVRDVETGHVGADVAWRLQLLIEIITRLAPLAARAELHANGGTYRLNG